MDGNHIALDAAIRLHQDKAAGPPVMAALGRDNVAMVVVDFRYEDRHILGLR